MIYFVRRVFDRELSGDIPTAQFIGGTNYACNIDQVRDQNCNSSFVVDQICLQSRLGRGPYMPAMTDF